MKTSYSPPAIQQNSVIDSEKKLLGLTYILVISSIVAVFIIPPPSFYTFIAAEIVILAFSLLTRRSSFTTSAAVLACITSFLVRINCSNLPFGYVFLGLIAVAICFYPIARSYNKPMFPILGIYGTVQGIYIFMATVVAAPTGAYVFVYPSRVRELGIIATAGFVLTYVVAGSFTQNYISGLSRFTRFTSTISKITNPKNVFYKCLLLFFVGIIFRRFLPAGISGKLGQIVVLIGLFRIIAIILLVYMWTEGNLTRSQKLITVALIAIDSIVGTSGAFALYSAIGAFRATLFVLTLKKRNIVLWILIFLIPVAVFMNVAKAEARLTYPNSVGHISATLNLIHLSRHALLHASKQEINQSADRFDHVEELGYLVMNVPKNYSYWNKQTYTLIPFLFIPRIIAPFKPQYGLANEFGRQYGLISPDDYVTSVNTPVEVEAWANFGLYGMIAIGILLGIILILYGRLFNRNFIDGFTLGIISIYICSGAIESGIVSVVEVVPFVVVLIPVVRWSLKS